MILDRLEQADLYISLHRHFSESFAFLGQNGLAELPVGRHEIAGEDIYAQVIKGSAGPVEEAKLEAHRKYIDIQFVVSGIDQMGWKSRNLCLNSERDYDPETDAELFSDTPSARVDVQPGCFAVFFPEDAHAPGCGKGEFHKVVVKVSV